MSGRWESGPFVDGRTPPEGCLLPALILDLFKVCFFTLYHGKPPLTDHLGEYVFLFPSILIKQIPVLQPYRLPQLRKLQTSGKLGFLVNFLRSRKKSQDEDSGMIDCLGISNGCVFLTTGDLRSLIFFRIWAASTHCEVFGVGVFSMKDPEKKQPFQKGKACLPSPFLVRGQCVSFRGSFQLFWCWWSFSTYLSPDGCNGVEV